MEPGERKRPKVVLAKKDGAVLKYEAYLKARPEARCRKDGPGQGLRKIMELQAGLPPPPGVEADTGAIQLYGWPFDGHGVLGLLTEEVGYEMGQTRVFESYEPFPLENSPSEPEVWHGTVEDGLAIQLEVQRDFRPVAGTHGQPTGKFRVSPALYYGGIADFHDLGIVTIRAETSVQLLDERFVDEQGGVTDPAGVLGLWSSWGPEPFSSTMTYINSGVMPIPGREVQCQASSENGAVPGTVVRVTQTFSIQTSGAVACFDYLGAIVTRTPTLSLWHMRPLRRVFPILPIPHGHFFHI
ncbi:MAG TPA: hypothetical protein VFL04_06610 [Rectinemataceae bacterium]|nr:hypothetical protein [Rectinemataceae bacterium]